VRRSLKYRSTEHEPRGARTGRRARERRHIARGCDARPRTSSPASGSVRWNRTLPTCSSLRRPPRVSLLRAVGASAPQPHPGRSLGRGRGEGQGFVSGRSHERSGQLSCPPPGSSMAASGPSLVAAVTPGRRSLPNTAGRMWPHLRRPPTVGMVGPGLERARMALALGAAALVLAACAGSSATDRSGGTGSGSVAATSANGLGPSPASAGSAGSPVGGSSVSSGPGTATTSASTGSQGFSAQRVGAGRLLLTTLAGPASGVTMRVWVWLPPQYDDPRYARTNFPVLVLFPGGDKPFERHPPVLHELGEGHWQTGLHPWYPIGHPRDVVVVLQLLGGGVAAVV